MVRTTALAAAAAALALNAHAESLYSKKSAVLQVNGPDYDRLITKSNYTSIVEFYAPWCGHCKNLKPAFESVAKSLVGIAKVAAVNCDDEMNKPLCGQMGVQGFPTLKIVRPGKKPGKPTVEPYEGPRQAKAIVDAVKDKIPNNVKRLTAAKLDEWLEENRDSAKAILFSDKGIVSATLRTLAIDFSGIISVAQIKKSEKAATEKYGVEKYPTLVLIPASSNEPVKYDGEMNKEAMVKFLSQVAPPNPECPEPKAKKPKAKKNEKQSKSSKASSAATSAAHETIEEANKPTESPDAKADAEDTPKPVVIPEEQAEPTIPVLAESAELQALCLNEKSTTCILALLPKESSEDATTAFASLATIHKKHDVRQGHLFPFVAVPASNPLATSLLTDLNLGSEDQVHLIATHGKRAWYKKYTGTSFGASEVETWVDAIRMGEGKKEKLPESLVAAKQEEKQEEKVKTEPVHLDDPPVAEQDTPEHSEL